MKDFPRDKQFVKFCTYGFLKNQQFFEPFLILFFLEQGIQFLQIGVLIAIREVAVNILEIPTGFIADIFGRRISMVFSLISYILSFIVFYFFGNFYIFIIAMLFFAFGEAFRTGTHKAMILEYLKINEWTKYKAHYYGHTRSWSQRGSALAALIGAGLVFYSGEYKIIFAASCVPYVFNLFLMLSYPKSLDGEKDRNNISMFQEVKASFMSFIYSFKDKKTFKAVLNSSFFNGQFESVKPYLQPVLQSLALGLPVFLYLQDTQKSAVVMGLVYCFLYVLTSFASSKAGDVKDTIGSLSLTLNIIFIASGVLTCVAGVLTHFKLFYLAGVLFIVLYILYNLRRPLSVAYISDCVPSKNMAAGLSVESQGKVLFNAGLSLLIGFIADRWGVGPAVISAGTVILAGSLLLNLDNKNSCKDTL